LTEEQVADALRAVPGDPVARRVNEAPPFRISLAGAQEKTAFVQVDGQWCRPLGATPSTHIFKLPLGVIANTTRVEMFDSVENEWLCAQIIQALGLPMAHTEMATFGDQRTLVVERFDREWMEDGKWIARLPQEDFCQALGLPPRLKYEDDGGPSVADGLKLLSGSTDAETDRTAFQLAQLAFWLMAAPDGHAKNFSIQLQAGMAGRFRLTPMYDVMSAYPVIGAGPTQWAAQDLKLAMALLGKNRHYHMQNIQRRHFNSTAKKVGYGENAEPLLQELVARTPEAVAQVQAELPQGFSQQVADKVLGGLLSAARALQGMPAT